MFFSTLTNERRTGKYLLMYALALFTVVSYVVDADDAIQFCVFALIHSLNQMLPERISTIPKNDSMHKLQITIIQRILQQR